MSILLVAIWMPFAFAVVLHRLTESKSMTIDSPKTMESRIDILSLLPLGVLVTSGIPQNLASVAIEGSKMAHQSVTRAKVNTRLKMIIPNVTPISVAIDSMLLMD